MSNKFIYPLSILGVILAGLVVAFGSNFIADAASVFLTTQGGTGSSTPSGIMYGDNGATTHLNTLKIGSNLTLSGGTLSATGGSGAAYPFTPTTWAGVQVSATSTGIWDTAALGLIASSSLINYASSTAITAGNLFATNATFTNALTVANGGTGAGTLTGCLTGNGTGAITGSGTCNTSNATVSSITGGTGLSGGTITTTGTFALKNFFATSTADTTGQVLYWNSNNATPALFTSSSGFTFDGTKLTFNYASSTLFATFAGGLGIPNSASSTLSAAGQLAMNTTAASSSLNYYDGAKDVVLPDVTDVAFTYINYPTSGTATSTFIVKGGPRGRVFVNGSCASFGAGTSTVQLGTGTASTTIIVAGLNFPTNNVTFSSNNTFQAWQDIRIDIGSFTSSGTTTTSCSYGKRYLY